MSFGSSALAFWNDAWASLQPVLPQADVAEQQVRLGELGVELQRLGQGQVGPLEVPGLERRPGQAPARSAPTAASSWLAVSNV